MKEHTRPVRASRSKKPKPPAWEIYRRKGARAALVGRLKAQPTAFVGVVLDAEDEEGAIAMAIEEHNVRPADQWRRSARLRQRLLAASRRRGRSRKRTPASS